jgi:hypothetical protein
MYHRKAGELGVDAGGGERLKQRRSPDVFRSPSSFHLGVISTGFVSMTGPDSRRFDNLQ